MDGPSAQRLAPWVAGDELSSLIESAENNWPFWARNQHGTIAQRLGERLQVTFSEKINLKLHHLGCNCDPSDVADYYREQKRERDRARRAQKRREASVRVEETTKKAPADYWDLMDSDPRGWALAGGILGDFQWWKLSDLAAQAGARLGPFRGSRSDTLRQAVHRATRRLERLGIVETKMEGRSKYVRRVPSAALEEQAREREALEEAAKDIDEDAG
jgi:hypothetical protein